MKAFVSVFKVSLLGLFKRSAAGSRKSRISTGVILALAFAYITGACFFAFFTLAAKLAPAGLLFIIPPIALVGSALLSLITCVSTASGNIIRIRDGDILFSLPISHRTVLAAKLAVLYVFELLYSAMVLLPASIAYLYYAGASFASVAGCVISVFAAPLIPLFIGILFAFLGSLIIKKMRFRNFVGIILFLAAFSAYFIFFSDTPKLLAGLMNNAESIKDSIRSYYFPAALYGNAMDGNILHALLLLAAGAIPVIALLFVFSGVYSSLVSSASSAVQSGKAPRRSIAKASSSSTPMLSWIRKEFQHYFSSMPFMLNTIASPVMSVLMSFLIFHRANEAGADGSATGKTIMFIVYLFISAGILCMSPTTSASISLEGKRMWLIHTLPVNKKTVLAAKVIMNLIICTVFGLINSVLIAVIGGYGIIESVSYFIIAESCVAVSSVAGLLINIWKPRLDYVNETQAIKQSMATLLSLLAGLLIAGAAALIYFAARALTDLLIVQACIIAGAMLLICYGLTCVLFSAGIKKLDTLSI